MKRRRENDTEIRAAIEELSLLHHAKQILNPPVPVVVGGGEPAEADSGGGDPNHHHREVSNIPTRPFLVLCSLIIQVFVVMATPGGPSGCKSPSFWWNDELLSIFADLVIAHQLRFGKKQPLKWREIAEEFSDRIGMPCTKESLRNKYENMKREYKAWMTLKHNETGIGWDPISGRIDAPDGWWEKKIKEDVHCKKFRTKGMNPAYEDLLVRLFQGQVASGRLAFSPSMHPSRLAQRYAARFGSNAPQGEEEIHVEHVGETGVDGDEYIRNFVAKSTDANDEFDTSPTAGQSQQQPIRFSPDPSPGQCSQRTGTSNKRRARQSIGTSKMDEHMQHTRSTADKLVGLLQRALESPKKTFVDSQVSNVVEAVHGLVDSGYIDDHGEEFYFGTSLAADRQFRQVFLSIRDDEHRVGWLRYEMQKRVQKRKR